MSAPSHRIIITVSRRWRDWLTMQGVLRTLHTNMPDAVLVHGDCHRGDKDAARLWTKMGGATEAHPADWRNCDPHRCDPTHRKVNKYNGSYCPTAGFRRNQHMVDLGADVCVAFVVDSSSGAMDCATRAEGAGIHVQMIALEQVI